MRPDRYSNPPPVVSIAGDNNDKTTFYPGEAVKVAVSTANAAGYSVEFFVTYDANYLALDTASVASNLSYSNKIANNVGTVDVVFYNVAADADPLFTLPFTVMVAEGVTLSAPADAVFAVTAEGSASGEGDAEALAVDADAASVTVTIDPGLKVEFVDATGNPMPSFPPQYVIPGTTIADDINVPADPTQGDGYVFAGWYDAVNKTTYPTADAVKTAAAAITQDTVYQATFTQLYTVDFKDKDGNAIDGSTTQYIVPNETNATLTVPTAPTVTGYAFTGGSDGTNTYATADAVKAATIAGNTTYQATYALDASVVQYVDYVGGYVRVDVTGALSGYAFRNAPMYKTGEKTFSFIYSGSEMKTLYGEKMTDAGLEESLLIGAVLSEYTFATADAAAAYDITETPVSEFNVNGSTKFDVADVRAVYNCMTVSFSVDTYMPVYLRADLDGSGEVDGDDVNLIVTALLSK